MTSHASRYLDTFSNRCCPGGRAPAGAVRKRHCGSHASTAAAAGTAHIPRASGTDPPDAWNSGTAISEPSIAPAARLSR